MTGQPRSKQPATPAAHPAGPTILRCFTPKCSGRSRGGSSRHTARRPAFRSALGAAHAFCDDAPEVAGPLQQFTLNPRSVAGGQQRADRFPGGREVTRVFEGVPRMVEQRPHNGLCGRGPHPQGMDQLVLQAVPAGRPGGQAAIRSRATPCRAGGSPFCHWRDAISTRPRAKVASSTDSPEQF
jgi:hypothetical protein